MADEVKSEPSAPIEQDVADSKAGEPAENIEAYAGVFPVPERANEVNAPLWTPEEQKRFDEVRYGGKAPVPATEPKNADVEKVDGKEKGVIPPSAPEAPAAPVVSGTAGQK